MFNILIWLVYGIFVGAIAKSVVPGEEKFGFFQTIVLGVCGSYVGGSIYYMLGMSEILAPAGIFLGVAGAIITLIAYKKIAEEK